MPSFMQEETWCNRKKYQASWVSPITLFQMMTYEKLSSYIQVNNRKPLEQN